MEQQSPAKRAIISEIDVRLEAGNVKRTFK